MRTGYKAAAWILLLAITGTFMPTYAVDLQQMAQSDMQPLGGRKPEDVIAKNIRTAATRSLTTTELVELSFSFMMLKQFDESVLAGKLALGTTSDSRQKAAIYALVAQSLAMSDKFADAGSMALEGQRTLGLTFPDAKSKRLAATLAAQRYVFFDKAGDAYVAEKMAAGDCLQGIDPDYKPTSLSLVAGGAIFALVASFALVIYRFVKNEPITENDKSYIETMWKVVGDLAVVPAP